MSDEKIKEFDEKQADEDSQLDVVTAVIVILSVTAIIVFWVANQ